MELINQHTKEIMEGCKERARAAGLSFTDESLEYIVTNRDLIELSPKVMIPTLYDYWVHDVEVLRGKGEYELYPHNPYETVINTRPPISFYNDNNPDWLNVMIFYHVLGHIDFFQNNLYFRHTWEYDFTGQALSDKRVIAKLRAEKGRWVDYILEFARSIDNLVAYHDELSPLFKSPDTVTSSRLDYYFDVFLQVEKKLPVAEYLKEVARYNEAVLQDKEEGERVFFAEVTTKYPEMEAHFAKSRNVKRVERRDLLRFLIENSEFLARDENRWMRSVLEVVRKTSIFFQPQIRTKIMNEGWASYWHEKLFLVDDRIKGHEVDFARVHAGVTSMPRVGMNPYALGMRLMYQLKDMGDKGRTGYDFHRLSDANQRKEFDAKTEQGDEFLFKVRSNYCDYLFIKEFVDQDFTNRYDLFVTGKRLDPQRMVWQYYVKSRDAREYRDMVLASLYHPPHIEIAPERGEDGSLYLVHHFEGKQLVSEYIANTMVGIEYLWGAPVQLETSEAVIEQTRGTAGKEGGEEADITWQRVVYTMNEKTLSRQVL
ncbi:SpoVR-like family protein [Citrifermentans bemidjiense Bem]|uniref:SpoVR-like family protein n=1 Tax=Citrifermentans bemidjiense (strain ATCC BAA-1014 / DSM 16622 / JCM 12645 / Bem) TaxID=404380 RepID=B5E9Y8_CITBB|nr:SpoVR family protein [Citrifermentans bemidjiense]ACH37286.1 SpoVR-like family protein [Citrifermentans bemidjiense Bem]